MAPKKVIKGNLKKGAFTGNAQFLKNKKSVSVIQTDVALVVVAGVAGGHDIAKTGHCGFAYNSAARFLKRFLLQYVQVP